jgi:hypothetical protein
MNVIKINLITKPQARSMPREIRRRLNSFKAAYLEMRQTHYLVLTGALDGLPQWYSDLYVRVERLKEAVPRELAERTERAVDKMFPTVGAESNYSEVA